MSELRPFFSYFGGKFRAATRYPPPLHGTIVEPFAGSAGYAMRYPHLRVVLIEKNPAIAGIWSYLVRAEPTEILALPLLQPGESLDDVAGLTQPQRWLIGMWLSAGVTSPRKTLCSWQRFDGYSTDKQFWGVEIRRRIASQVERIRHWQILEGDFTGAPDMEATWFIDPPYVGMGTHYPCGSDAIDYAALADWCRSRRGQVMVCEQAGAEWLPFSDFGRFKSNKANTSRSGAPGRARSAEALWTNDFPGASVWCPPGMRFL